MTKPKSEWGLIVGIAIVGAVLFALPGGGDSSFAERFVYALAGLTTLTASMIGTVFAITWIGKGSEAETAILWVAWLVGIFVTTPLALWLVFELLQSLFE